MADITKKTKKDLLKILDQERKKVADWRIDNARSSGKNPKELHTSKKLIAQILTELRAREIRESTLS